MDLSQGATSNAKEPGWLPGLSLSTQFAFAAAVIMFNGMALLGGWVVNQIEKGLLHNTAVAETAEVQSLLAPVIPDLVNAGSPRLSAEIGNALKATPFGRRLTSFAVWLPDSTIVFSTDQTIAGHRFPQNLEVKAALKDEIRTALWDQRLLLGAAQFPNSEYVRTVYSPIHDPATGKVVAVAEIADDAHAMKRQLDAIRRRTWLVVGVSTLLMLLLLSVIVHRGTLTIAAQQDELQRRYAEQKRLAGINADLNTRLQDANRRGIEIGEQVLKRVGTGLHDGPAQLLALALLRMHELKADQQTADAAGSVVDIVERATSGALREIREISSNLMLPELEKLKAEDAVWAAVHAHERSTATDVACEVGDMPDRLPLPVTICIFRFVQEGLANAYKHAEGRGQLVEASADGETVRIVVSDEGPGFSGVKQMRSNNQLGLRGLRQRVESIGGTFDIATSEGRGTRITAVLPLSALRPG